MTVDHKPVRGRPRDEEKHSAIIFAATRLFLEQGFSGTSMDEVAKRAGVSKQTVYSHFSSKEQLFGTAIHNAVERYFPDTVLGKLEAHSLEGDLRAVCESYSRLLLSSDALSLHRVLVSEAVKDNNLGKIFMDSGPAEMEEKLCDVIKVWEESGELEIDNIEKAAELLFVLIKGRPNFMYSVGVIDGVTEDMIQSNIDHAVDVFLRLYQKK